MNNENDTTGFFPDPMQVQKEDERVIQFLKNNGFEEDEIKGMFDTPEKRKEFMLWIYIKIFIF